MIFCLQEASGGHYAQCRPDMQCTCCCRLALNNKWTKKTAQLNNIYSYMTDLSEFQCLNEQR